MSLVLLLLPFVTFAQKGKPPACPVPTPPTGDTRCTGGSGCFDASFGSNGSLLFRPTLGNVTDIGIQKVMVQPDGKMVGAGQVFDSSRSTHRDFFVIRVHSDGSLDNTFGDVDPNNPVQRLGYIIDQIGESTLPADAAYSLAYSAVDGKIVVSGASDSASVIVRYTADGRRDAGFGNNGVVRPGIALQAMDVAVQADGRIVADLWDRFTAIRLNYDGSFDPTFGSGGIAAYDASATAYGSGSARSIAIHTVNTPSGSEERIVLGGAGYDAVTKKQQNSAVSQMALMRLRSDGSIDTSFGTGGRVKVSINNLGDNVFDLHIDEENKIIAGGQSAANTCDQRWDASFARFNENGSLLWKRSVDIYGFTNWNYGVGSQVVGGQVKTLGFGSTYRLTSPYTPPSPDIVVIRLNADGTPDASFGPGTFGAGRVTANISATDHGLGGSVDQMNRIVIVGSSSNGVPAIAATMTVYLP